ncbi:MAG: nuclease PIN [Flavobacteriaceae bacterium]|nr:MAG: nuclease PIN [Flavobacteriaceae bacterium]
MKTYKTIQYKGNSDFVHMGPIRLRQPIPSQGLDHVDPFLLLHHYGPYQISAESNPFDLGPHPHRGFEPITFLIQGEQLHRDSLGNESLVQAGDVQWTTAGRGIIHAEGPDKAFVEKGGVLEGIQLWLNLPAAKKMMPANYQHVKVDDMPVKVSVDGKVKIQNIAGTYKDTQGLIQTQTLVNALMVDLEVGGKDEILLGKEESSLVYLIHGEVLVNDTETLSLNETQLLVFNSDGDRIAVKATHKSKLLILSATPIGEPVASYGPYVMNSQTEIMEAMRDFQEGKMGFLAS